MKKLKYYESDFETGQTLDMITLEDAVDLAQRRFNEWWKENSPDADDEDENE